MKKKAPKKYCAVLRTLPTDRATPHDQNRGTPFLGMHPGGILHLSVSISHQGFGTRGSILSTVGHSIPFIISQIFSSTLCIFPSQAV